VWLAEHADVDLPGKYEFWGRFTPDGAKPHQRVLHVDERTIRFAWTVEGIETTAQFELAEDEGGTLVTLSQSDLPSFQDVLADTAGARGALSTFWSLAIANLADYLSGRELTPKCDFTSAELHASVVIDAAPEQVFDSMTQPEQFRRWFGANVDIEPYVGGRFAMGGFELDPGGAKFVEFEPGRKATLRFADGMTDSWELEGSDGKTRLTVVESGFDPANPPYPGRYRQAQPVGTTYKIPSLTPRGTAAAETPGHPDGIDVHGHADTPTKIQNISNALKAALCAHTTSLVTLRED